MQALVILSIIENILFWLLVAAIAWLQRSAPQWMFVTLFIYLLYMMIRVIINKHGMERIVYIYTLNMIVALGLLMYFRSAA
jgi:hypothetical protein